MRTKQFLVILFVIIFLSGCSSRIDHLNKIYKSESQQCEDMIYSIASAINEDNQDVLKELFTVTARNSSPTIDEDILHIMDAFDGDIVSLNSISGYTSEKNDYGAKEISISKSYEVNTETDTYLFRIEIRRNDNDKDDNGLYNLEIVKKENDQFLLWMLHFDKPGIFVGNQLESKDYIAGLVGGLYPIIPSRLIDIFSDKAKNDNNNLLDELEAFGDQFRGNIDYDEIDDVEVLSNVVVDGTTYITITSSVTTYTSDNEVLNNYNVVVTYIPYINEDDKGGLYNAYILEGDMDMSKIEMQRLPGLYYIDNSN